MGTSQDLGGQTGGHILKFWKNKRIPISQNSSFCSLKLLVIIFCSKGIICYRLPEDVTEEREKNIFRG